MEWIDGKNCDPALELAQKPQNLQETVSNIKTTNSGYGFQATSINEVSWNSGGGCGDQRNNINLDQQTRSITPQSVAAAPVELSDKAKKLGAIHGHKASWIFLNLFLFWLIIFMPYSLSTFQESNIQNQKGTSISTLM